MMVAIRAFLALKGAAAGKISQELICPESVERCCYRASIFTTFLKYCLLTMLSAFILTTAQAAVIDSYEFASPEQEAQFFRLNSELRCPQCQNQSIGDSNAPIAQDLRREVHRMIVQEQADDDTIVQFMLVRYGDFVLYKPRMNATTAVLWLGPLVLLLLGLLVLWRLLRRHRTQASGLNEQERAALKKILGDQ